MATTLMLSAVGCAPPHGDTALAAFGPRREYLLAYRDAIAPKDWPRLVEAFGDALLPLNREDAKRYAANSFTYTPVSSPRSGSTFRHRPSSQT